MLHGFIRFYKRLRIAFWIQVENRLSKICLGLVCHSRLYYMCNFVQTEYKRLLKLPAQNGVVFTPWVPRLVTVYIFALFCPVRKHFEMWA